MYGDIEFLGKGNAQLGWNLDFERGKGGVRGAIKAGCNVAFTVMLLLGSCFLGWCYLEVKAERSDLYYLPALYIKKCST